MTNTDFLNSNEAKQFLLFSIEDVDDFVLRVAERLSDQHQHWDIRNVKRLFFESEFVGDKYEDRQLTASEYDSLSEISNEEGVLSKYFTILNYNEFESEFPLNELEDWYGIEWIHNNGFISKAFDWVEGTDGDVSKALRLKDLLEKLHNSKSSLGNIKYYWTEDYALNPIQRKVILVHINFIEVVTGELRKRYAPFYEHLFLLESTAIQKNKNPFPDLFKTHKVYLAFEEYSKRHIIEPYIDFSYLFQRLLHEKLIHKHKQKEFAQWILEWKYITDKTYELILDRRGFYTFGNCTSPERENNFNNIFNI